MFIDHESVVWSKHTLAPNFTKHKVVLVSI